MCKGKAMRCYGVCAQRGEGEGGAARAHCMLLANGNDYGWGTAVTKTHRVTELQQDRGFYKPGSEMLCNLSCY